MKPAKKKKWERNCYNCKHMSGCKIKIFVGEKCDKFEFSATCKSI